MATWGLLEFKEYKARGVEGKQGAAGPPGPVTIIDVNGETVITGPAGADGKDAEVKFQVIRVLEGMNTIVLPEPADVPEIGLYYYKDTYFEITDPVFKLSNGLIVGKFYRNRIQNITFLKANGVWVN